MAGIGLPLMEQLKGRMQWLQTRQKVLAENVANADTPGFKPRDLRAQSAGGFSLALAQTEGNHMVGTTGQGAAASKAGQKFETVPSGNAITLEDEMLKVAETQMDYQTVASLYSKSLSLLMIAVGKRG